VKYWLGLALVLATFWMINSGYFKPILLGLGTFSVFTVLYIMWRMDRIGDESYPPIMPSWHLPGYLFWLGVEIIKSNFTMVRLIWQRDLDLSPQVFTVKVGPRGDVARVIYANSITMTPGTVTMDVRGDEFKIHALTQASADGVKSGDMDRHVTRLEG